MKDRLIKDPFPKRKNIRLSSYDYSLPGAYFVTICTHNRQCLFGTIKNDIMSLNPYGEIVQECWKDTPQHYSGISNDIFVIMPNHIHGIIIIHETKDRSGSKPDPTKRYPLSEIVRAFKAYSSRRINERRNSRGVSIWQRSYYEHVIRSEKEHHEIGEYIIYNPAKWAMDSENPNSRLNIRRLKMAAIDPVCHMTVDEKNAAATSEYKGQKYYFCAVGCKKAFDKDPEKYLAKK